jgi:hypothetical protein
MFATLIFLTAAMASAAGTIWVYWGVPRRVVATWSIGVGAGYAALNALLWLFFEGGFETRPIYGIFCGVAIGIGIAFGGLVSLALYRFNRPSRQDGA